SLEKVAFFLQIDHLGHPWKWIFFLTEERLKTNLLAPAIGDESQIRLEHRGVQTQHAARHGVFSVSIFKVYSLFEQFTHLFAKLCRPQMRVLEFDRVDQIDAEIAVHGFVAKNVHVLLGGACHFVLATQCQDLRKTNIKEQAFHQASKNDQ